MKIFATGEDSWDQKINFVDDNNVLVGFDYNQCCCEQFGWFLSTTEPTEINYCDPQDLDTEDYQFDTTYFKEVNIEVSEYENMAIFRLVKGDNEIFLTLYNSHNGYYSHGFHMDVGGTTIYSNGL